MRFRIVFVAIAMLLLVPWAAPTHGDGAVYEDRKCSHVIVQYGKKVANTGSAAAGTLSIASAGVTRPANVTHGVSPNFHEVWDRKDEWSTYGGSADVAIRFDGAGDGSRDGTRFNSKLTWDWTSTLDPIGIWTQMLMCTASGACGDSDQIDGTKVTYTGATGLDGYREVTLIRDLVGIDEGDQFVLGFEAIASTNLTSYSLRWELTELDCGVLKK